jgi:hypothetical protein
MRLISQMALGIAWFSTFDLLDGAWFEVLAWNELFEVAGPWV